jgi:hypothetical protein
MHQVSRWPGLRVERSQTSFLIALPIGSPIPSQLMQIAPGEQTGIMTVVEDDLDGVLAYGLHGSDADILFAEHQYFLSRTMSLHLRGGRMHAQVLERQLKPAAVVKTHFQQPRFAADLDFGRNRIRHSTPSIGPDL